MAAIMRVTMQSLLLLVCLLLLLELSGVYGKGGGRGGGRGGRGGSRSSRSSRSRSRSSSRKTSRFRGLSWRSALSAGHLYGSSHYARRRRYTSNSNDEPTICTNLYAYRMSNGTYYKYFICPTPEQPNNKNGCCGPESYEYCCSFWDKPGNVVGVVFGILVGVGIIGACLYCCCCMKDKKEEPDRPLTDMTIEPERNIDEEPKDSNFPVIAEPDEKDPIPDGNAFFAPPEQNHHQTGGYNPVTPSAPPPPYQAAVRY